MADRDTNSKLRFKRDESSKLAVEFHFAVQEPSGIAAIFSSDLTHSFSDFDEFYREKMTITDIMKDISREGGSVEYCLNESDVLNGGPCLDKDSL